MVIGQEPNSKCDVTKKIGVCMMIWGRLRRDTVRRYKLLRPKQGKSVRDYTCKMIKAIGLDLGLFRVFRKQTKIDAWTARIGTHREA